MDPSYPVVAEEERTIKRSYNQDIPTGRYKVKFDQALVFIPSDAREIRSFMSRIARTLLGLDDSTTNSHRIELSRSRGDLVEKGTTRGIDSEWRVSKALGRGDFIENPRRCPTLVAQSVSGVAE